MLQGLDRYVFVTVLIITNVLLSKETVKSNKEPPLWTWECIDGKCTPSQIIDPNLIQSLPTCNMICAPSQIWPHPTGPFSIVPKTVAVRAKLFQLKVGHASSPEVQEYVKEAFELFIKDLSSMENEISGFVEWQAVAVHIFVNEDKNIRMMINTDESYTLWLRTETEDFNNVLIADITAKSFCGALRGLETLKQLIWWDPYINSLRILEGANVEDGPKFRYRGLMFDTSRNFFPVPDLIRTIDAMAANKLNTFHWHIHDSQAIALLFSDIQQPQLDDEYTSDNSYSIDDMRTIVNHARLRGIRVMVELDTPAHASNAWEDWGSVKNIRDLVFCQSPTDVAYCDEPPCGQLNPKNPYVYELLELLYSEILGLTGVDDIFHIGGDDINLQCWRDNIKDADPVELWLGYTKLALRQLEKANKGLPNITLLWSSVNATDLIKTELREFVGNIGFQTRSADWTAKYVSGIRTIVSHENAWDLNNGFGTWNRGGKLYNNWKQVYEHRPWVRKGDLKFVEGGEVTVWTKNLNPGGLDGVVWPRAAAFAERMWSDRTDGATRLVEARLDVHRSRLVSRGIQAAPIWSMWCTQNPFTCD